MAFGARWAWTLQKRVISEKLTYYPTGKVARCDKVDVPADATDIKIGRGEKSVGYWEEFPDEWILEARKTLSFAALKAEREFFTPESEAEFQRKTAQSSEEAAKFPPARPALFFCGDPF